MRMRPITMAKAQDGGTLVRLPLGPEGQFFAEVDLDDWNALLSKGLTGNANYIEAGGKRYVSVPSWITPGRNVMLARVIAGAGRGQRVHYRDGNTLNLRRSNLEVRSTKRMGNYREAIASFGEGRQ